MTGPPLALAEAPLWPVQIGGAVIALAGVALAVAALVRLAGILRGGVRPWLLERRALLLILAVAALLRLVIAPTTELWYAPVAGRAFGSLVPGVAGLLLFASRLAPALAPFSLLAGLVILSGLGCVWQSFRLGVELGLPVRTAAVAGLGFALWPSFVRISTTDGSHVVALFLWLTAARAWRAAAPLRLGPVLLAGACLFALPFLHRETLAWPLAALCLRPPQRGSGLPTWLTAGALAVGPVMVARAFSSVPPFHAEEGPSWMSLPFAPLSMASGMSLTGVGAVAVLALGILGAPGLYRSHPLVVWRLLAMLYALFLPMLLGAHPADDTLSLRYYLPCELAAFVVVASGLARVGAFASRPARIVVGVAGVGVLLVEGWRGLSDAGQDVYQAELTFLRRGLSRLGPGSTLCMLAPEINQSFPGSGHVDLAASYSPGPLGDGRPTLMGWYLGRPDVSVIAWDTEQLGAVGACDAYYESSICHLTAGPEEPDSVRADVPRIRELCAKIRARLVLDPLAAGVASGRSHKGRTFDPGPVPLALFHVRRPDPGALP